MNCRNVPWCHWNGDYLILDLCIQPKARHDEITGPLGDRLKIRIAAPPTEGKANRELVRFLAEIFDVPKSRVRLLSGISSREKQVRIDLPMRVPSPFPSRSED